MELNIYNTSGAETGKKVTLDDKVFGIEPSDHAIYLDVKLYLANQRQGTHKAKERGEVRGSTRKIKRQKGTGTARAGSIRNPIFKGGGRIFGPKPRDYSFKLNKKQRQLARKSALSYKAQQGGITVVEDFTFDAPKTKSFVALAENLKLADKKLLILLPELNENVMLSARNLQNVKIALASHINTYDVMNAGAVLMPEGSVSVINELLA